MTDLNYRLALGVDLVSVSRFKAFANRSASNFPAIFTRRELELPESSLAGNFAVKEALLKVGFLNSFRDFNRLGILRNYQGKPVVEPSTDWKSNYPMNIMSITLSNESDLVIAVVLVNY